MKKVFSISSSPVSGNDRLVVRLGNYHFSFAVADNNANELRQLAYYTNADILDEASLTEVFQQEELLRRSFDDVRIAFDYPYAILVPAVHATAFPVAAALELQFGPRGSSTIETERVSSWQLNNQFAVPAGVMQWIRTHFPKVKITHGYTADLCRIESTDFEGGVALDFRSEEFTLLASRGNKLLLTQTYTYESPADVIYYLLRVIQQFGFSQEEVRLSLSGLIEKESSLYRELYQYFIHLRFREAEWQVNREDENLPAHFFTSLFDLAKCG
ncbi:MAG: DUF3822 family protein [Chitinophagaceae bacterium]|nr:DUF3822 family protein [Chitinophagaceae bacterium]